MPRPDLYRVLSATALVALSMPALAFAQGQAAMPPPAAPVACAAVDKAVPAPWTGWTTPDPLLGGANLGAAGKLMAGHSYAATLSEATGVAYAVPPSKPPVAGSFAGLFTLTVDKAGTYAIALSEGAWIDVAPAAGKALTSVAHSHGPDCTSIHKVVEFTLQPGAYIVQISAALKSPVTIAVEPKG